jgi:hypothetical protein
MIERIYANIEELLEDYYNDPELECYYINSILETNNGIVGIFVKRN